MNETLKICSFASVLVLFCVVIVSGSVELDLIIDDHGLGTWDLYAVTDPANDSGLAALSVLIYGADVVVNDLPRAGFVDPNNSEQAAIGFSIALTSDQGMVGGSQNIYAADAMPIYYLGQLGGDFGTMGPAGNLFIPAESVNPVFEAYLLVAHGTYSDDYPTICVVAANVFLSDSGLETFTVEVATNVKMTRADINHDESVDFADLATLGRYWQAENCAAPSWCERADINIDFRVDIADLAALASNWLASME